MNYLKTENILNNVKLMLDIKVNDFDEKLSFLINLILDEICIYTMHKNKETLSKKLENTVSDIVIKYLKVNNLGIESIKTSDAKSIKRGDTTIEFNTSNILQAMQGAGYIEQEIRILNYFRKVKMA